MLARPPVFRSGTVLFGVAVSAVLQSSPSAGQSPIVRDSAGVRIVQNPPRARAPVAFRIGTTPVVDVGGPEENTNDELDSNHGYLSAARLSDNGIAVIDPARVHYFDARGKRLRIVGRQGAGPEEFRYLIGICQTRGDTLVITDSHNRRLAILDRTGAILRTVRLEDIGSTPFEACLDDGTVILQRTDFQSPGVKKKVRVTRVRVDGTVANTVGEFMLPGFDMVTQVEPPILARGQRVYIGDAFSSEIRVYTPAGKLTTIIRSADPQVRITPAQVEERMRSTIPMGTPSGEVAQRLARMRARPHAETWPTYRDVKVDPRGTIWVQDYTTEYPRPDGWTAFGADGRMIGRLVIPAPAAGRRRMDVIAFGVNEVLVRRSDEDGFAHLTVYPIQSVRH